VLNQVHERDAVNIAKRSEEYLPSDERRGIHRVEFVGSRDVNRQAREMRRGAGIIARRAWWAWFVDPVSDGLARHQEWLAHEWRRQDKINYAFAAMTAALATAVMAIGACL